MTFHHHDGRPIGAPWAQDWIAREIANANRPPQSPIVRAGWRAETALRVALVALLIAFVAVNAHHVIRLFA